MFGMGMGEIILIAVVALLVLGPDRLPGAAKAIGKGIRDLRMQTKDLQQTIEKDTQLGDAVRELRGALRGDPETLYERATGQRFSDGLTKTETKRKSQLEGDSSTGTVGDAPEFVSQYDVETSLPPAPAEAADTAPEERADAAPKALAAEDAGAEDPDSESFEPVIRSAAGAVARSDEGGDNSSHG